MQGLATASEVLHSHITKWYGLLQWPDGGGRAWGLEDACRRALWSLIFFAALTLIRELRNGHMDSCDTYQTMISNFKKVRLLTILSIKRTLIDTWPHWPEEHINWTCIQNVTHFKRHLKKKNIWIKSNKIIIKIPISEEKYDCHQMKATLVF